MALVLVVVGVVAGATLFSQGVDLVAASLMGGPFERLPTEQRAELGKRVIASFGGRIPTGTEAEVQDEISQLLVAGLARLDDATLVERLNLYRTMMDRVDPVACRAMAQLGGPTLDEAMTAGLETFTLEELYRWGDINVRAMEAQHAGQPDPVALDTAEVDATYQTIVAGLDAATLDAIIAIDGGGQVPDAEACAAAQGLYDAILALPQEQLVLMARFDVSQVAP